MSQDVTGHSSRVGKSANQPVSTTPTFVLLAVVRTISTGKVIAEFSEVSGLAKYLRFN